MKLVLAFLIAGAVSSGWQEDTPDQILQLEKIRSAMTRNLSLMPDYTCMETISRLDREPSKMVVSADNSPGPFRRRDLVRLEVAEVGGKELLARPGDAGFQATNMADLAPRGGLTGNGVFSSISANVFDTNAPVFHYAGKTESNGRTLIRYDFEVPEALSSYNIKIGNEEATVGYSGSFWADAETLQPVRISLSADHIPEKLGISDSTSIVDYAVSRVGSKEVLLPQSAWMTISYPTGVARRNQIEFTHCREYRVKSVISFDDIPAGGSGGRLEIEIPAGLQLPLRLEEAVDSDHARVGDEIHARFEKTVKYKSDVLIPQQARVFGRIRKIEKGVSSPSSVAMSLEFSRVEFGDKEALFVAAAGKMALPPKVQAVDADTGTDPPGVVTIYGNGRIVLPAGTGMVWRSIK